MQASLQIVPIAWTLLVNSATALAVLVLVTKAQADLDEGPSPYTGFSGIHGSPCRRGGAVMTNAPSMEHVMNKLVHSTKTLSVLLSLLKLFEKFY